MRTLCSHSRSSRPSRRRRQSQSKGECQQQATGEPFPLFAVCVRVWTISVVTLWSSAADTDVLLSVLYCCWGRLFVGRRWVRVGEEAISKAAHVDHPLPFFSFFCNVKREENKKNWPSLHAWSMNKTTPTYTLGLCAYQNEININIKTN